MAKFYNNRVKTGKLAGSVYAVRFGETIERAYQPVVSNPRTALQVASRARLKLLSQLSAVMGPFIAIAREGAVSPRNIFTKVNYGITLYGSDTASIDLNKVQLTRSVVSLPTISAARGSGTIEAMLTNGTQDLSRVVYIVFSKNNDGSLRHTGSQVVTDPGANFKFTASIPAEALESVVYAYGVRDNSEAARAAFGNMTVLAAEQVAKLVTVRTLTGNDITLTETQAVTVPAGA